MEESICGIKEYKKYFPDKPLFYFTEVLEFRWYQNYDPVEGMNSVTIEMRLASDELEKDVLFLKFLHVESGSFDLHGQIMGLEIIDLKREEYGWERRYEIKDFEDNAVQFYCDEIEVKVLKAGGMITEENVSLQ